VLKLGIIAYDLLFFLFGCRELSVVVRMGSYFSLSDGGLRHIQEGKHSHLLLSMHLVMGCCN
jgi:hypothetical protein